MFLTPALAHGENQRDAEVGEQLARRLSVKLAVGECGLPALIMTSGLFTGSPVEEHHASGAADIAPARVPSTPPEAPNMAIGLAAKGCGVMRDSQSMAFFSTPEGP